MKNIKYLEMNENKNIKTQDRANILREIYSLNAYFRKK